MSNIKEVHGSQPTFWSIAAMLRDTVPVAVVRSRPQAIPLAMITMRKSTHGFPFLSSMSMGLHLAALRAARAPLLSLLTKTHLLFKQRFQRKNKLVCSMLVDMCCLTCTKSMQERTQQ